MTAYHSIPKPTSQQLPSIRSGRVSVAMDATDGPGFSRRAALGTLAWGISSAAFAKGEDEEFGKEDNWMTRMGSFAQLLWRASLSTLILSVCSLLQTAPLPKAATAESRPR